MSHGNHPVFFYMYYLLHINRGLTPHLRNKAIGNGNTNYHELNLSQNKKRGKLFFKAGFTVYYFVAEYLQGIEEAI